MSDLVNIEKFDLGLDKGTPFKPFEELLAVLPAYSRNLLPEAFQVCDGIYCEVFVNLVEYYFNCASSNE